MIYVRRFIVGQTFDLRLYWIAKRLIGYCEYQCILCIGQVLQAMKLYVGVMRMFNCYIVISYRYIFYKCPIWQCALRAMQYYVYYSLITYIIDNNYECFI